ncbi:MAG: ABC transporter ATP-binding protein [Clostridia bacterium]|nr:ABC transporter ATP-binding protein [Clostridia bacterium]
MIEIKGLKKSFGKTEAIRGVDLAISKGEFFGLLGPNGAGKTTTINILSTLLKPDAGTITIDGHDVQRDAAKCKQLIGVAPQELALYSELTAYENLMFWGRLYGIPHEEAATRSLEMLQLFELDNRRNSLLKTFSGGMKRRVNIAAAMIHRPQILLMDEPTVGVDPQSRHQIYQVLAQFASEGITIIYTTHYMDEVEKLCSRIGIIDHGEIIACGTLAELRAFSGDSQLIVVTFENILPDQLEMLRKEFSESVIIADDKLSYKTGNVAADLPPLISRSADLGLVIRHVTIEHTTLETIFLSLTGRKLRE